METSRLDVDCVVTAASDVPFTKLHDELLGISEQRGYCYSLNLPAARIWELIQQPVTVGSVCERLCAEFEVEPDPCFRDVADFVFAMKVAGLVEVSHGPA